MSPNARTASPARSQSGDYFSPPNIQTEGTAPSLPCGCMGLVMRLSAARYGQPEIKGYTQEYLDASSPRREQIKEHLQEIGRDGAGAAQVAAHRTRDSKELLSPEEVLQRHRELAAQFGHQADRVVAQAREQVHHHAQQPEKTVQQSVTYSRAHVFERS